MGGVKDFGKKVWKKGFMSPYFLPGMVYNAAQWTAGRGNQDKIFGEGSGRMKSGKLRPSEVITKSTDPEQVALGKKLDRRKKIIQNTTPTRTGLFNTSLLNPGGGVNTGSTISKGFKL